MLDIKYIRENKEKVVKNTANRGVDSNKADVEKLLSIYDNYHNLLVEIENLRSERNKYSKENKEENREKGKEKSKN